MSLEALRAAVQAEGRERVAAIRSQAEAEAAHLRHSAESAAAELHGEALQRGRVGLQHAAGTRLAKARGAARARVLEARAALLGRVFERARERLPECIGSATGRAWLVERAEEALAHMPDGEVTVVCSIEIAPAIEASLGEKENVRIERDSELPPGLRVVGAGGALTVDATLEKLLELNRPRLAIGVLQQLEVEEPG